MSLSRRLRFYTVAMPAFDGLAERVRASWVRGKSACERGLTLRAQASRLLKASVRRLNADANLIDPDDLKYQVWVSRDGTVSCSVIPHAPSFHEVALLHLGRVEYCRGFIDPVEATDEALRLRRRLDLGFA